MKKDIEKFKFGVSMTSNPQPCLLELILQSFGRGDSTYDEYKCYKEVKLPFVPTGEITFKIDDMITFYKPDYHYDINTWVYTISNFRGFGRYDTRDKTQEYLKGYTKKLEERGWVCGKLKN